MTEMELRPRDFILTKENLVFAVVSYVHEEGRILSFLRYVPEDSGFRKVNTEEAQEFLKNKFPEYLFYSRKFDANLHGVPVGDIKKILRPQERLQELLNSNESELDDIERKVLKLAKIFSSNGISLNKIGVTGSVLIKNQNENSDVDLVIYGAKNFMKARTIVRELTVKGELSKLSDALWMDAYERRKPSLSFDEFLRHEKRKFNKGAIFGTKFDIALIRDESEILPDEKTYKKSGKIKITAKVIDDKFAFDYPARYKISGEFSEVVSFTHTYVGQAETGETIEVSGTIEESCGEKRIVVGTTREAKGEYIKVVG